jgi:hypothetical protein
MKDQLSPTGRRVYILGDTLKPDVPVVQKGDRFNEVFQ